jgi:hypothetical protein
MHPHCYFSCFFGRNSVNKKSPDHLTRALNIRAIHLLIELLQVLMLFPFHYNQQPSQHK